MQDVLESITHQSDSQRVSELQATNQSVVERLLDLTRFIPIKLGSSDTNDDGFLMPNYLRPDYEKPPSESHLLQSK